MQLSTSTIVAALAVVAPTVTASLNPPKADFYADLATRVGKDVVDKTNSFGAPNRRLEWTEFNFRRQVCEPFSEGFDSVAPEGSSCECKTSTFGISCTFTENCFDVNSCEEQICSTATVDLDFDERGTQLVLVSVEASTDYTGGDYEGERAFVTSDECAQYIILDGLAYPCDRCEFCGTDGSISLDCSNIQPGATRECFDVTDISSPEELMEFCPEGGAPIPDTEGEDPAGIRSSAVTFSTVISSLILLAGAFLGEF